MIHFTSLLLLADLVDVLQALVPIAVFVIWIISQVVGAGEGNKNKPGKRPARPVPPPGGKQPAAGEAKAGGGESLRSEIESFLREAAGGEKSPPRQGRSRREEQQGESVQRYPVGREQPSRRGEVIETIDAEVIAEPPERISDSDRWRDRDRNQYDGSSEKPRSEPARGGSRPSLDQLREYAQRQESEVEDADNEMASHLAKAFGGDIGSFGPDITDSPESDTGQPITADITAAGIYDLPGDVAEADDPFATRGKAAASDTAAAIRTMMSSPGGMRQAIILGEILNRRGS